MGSIATKVAAPKIGPYQLLQRLGSGGAGTVYLAQDTRNQRLVAIKVAPLAVVTNPVMRLRFARECQLTQKLVHPHVVCVLDYGLEGMRAYMVMEHIDGPSVGDLIEKSGALPEAVALRIIHQIGQALHWAHQQNLVHRDVKPDNILLTADGHAKLADLGLAKHLDDDLDLTKANVCLGTPNFMAPEQFEDPRAADVRSDVYSLGATLYMMVTGVLPFSDPSSPTRPAAYDQQLAQLVPPRQLATALRPAVEAAILRAMRPEPPKRYPSVTAFLEALPPPPTPDVEQPSTAAPQARELRRKKRFTCRRPASCELVQRPFDETRETWTGRLDNISETGLCLRLGRRFERGALLALSVDGTPTARRAIVIRIIWVKKVAANQWKMGCQYDFPLCDFEVKHLLEHFRDEPNNSTSDLSR